MKKIDVYLANLLVGNVKLHNLHWNVKGTNFVGAHEYLESIYDDFFEKLDEVAEYQKQVGDYPKASVKDYLEISSVKELESKDYSVKESIELALELIKMQKELALKIREESSEEEFVLANMMEDHITGYNKEIWFMESMLV